MSSTSTFTDTRCAWAATPRQLARRWVWSQPMLRHCARPPTCTISAWLRWISGCSAKLRSWTPKSRRIRDHTIIGHQIVSHVQFPWPQIPEIVRWHHERADGSGYPDGLHGDEIPQAVRIVALAETFDAMISERPYRERMSVGAALQELIRLTPQKYDPQALHALMIQVRRDAIGTNRVPILDAEMLNLSARDVDQLASTLQHRISHDKLYLT